jgi:hypothetical protein
MPVRMGGKVRRLIFHLGRDVKATVTVVICVLISIAAACGPVPPRKSAQEAVPRNLVPPGFAPEDCHFEQADVKHESVGSSAEDLQDAARLSADSKPQRAVRCTRQTEVIHSITSCIDANGQERPLVYCKEHGGGDATSVATPDMDKIEGTSAQPHLRRGGPNGIIRYCDEDG